MFSTSRSDNDTANEDMQGRIRKEARDTASAAKETARDLRDTARHSGERVQSFVETAGHNVGEAASTMSTKIRENPVQSSLIALGVGFFAGMLFRR